VAKKGKDFKMNTPLFSIQDLNQMGAELVDAIRHVTFNVSNPKQSNNSPFPPYSAGYKRYKAKGGGFKQDSTYANSTAPVFSGDLWKDLIHSTNPKKNTFSVGWNTEAYKIDELAKKGRVITSSDHPVNPKAIARVMPRIAKTLNKVLVTGTQHITMGKKK